MSTKTAKLDYSLFPLRKIHSCDELKAFILFQKQCKKTLDDVAKTTVDVNISARTFLQGFDVPVMMVIVKMEHFVSVCNYVFMLRNFQHPRWFNKELLNKIGSFEHIYSFILWQNKSLSSLILHSNESFYIILNINC